MKRAGTAQREANRVAGRHPTRLIGVLTVAFGIGQVAGPIVAATLAISIRASMHRWRWPHSPPPRW